MKSSKTRKKKDEEQPEEEGTELYYVIENIHIHDCEKVVIKMSGEPPSPPTKPPGGQ
jgi:hypothetical protein